MNSPTRDAQRDMEVVRAIYFGRSRYQKVLLQSMISTLEKYRHLEGKKKKDLNTACSVKISRELW